jgi:polar amino acid transport system substrate-binding protein
VCSQSHADHDIVLSYAKESAYQLMAKRILTEAYHQIGFSISLEKLPAIRSGYYVEDGSADGLLARSLGVKEQHPDLIMISVPVAYDVISVYTKMDIKVEGWESLLPYNIGYVAGSKTIEQKTQGMKVEGVRSETQGLIKLDLGRSDVFIGLTGAQCVINKLNLSDIKSLDPPLETVILFHFLNKEHSELAKKLELILRNMKSTGRIEELQKQSVLEFMNQC